MNTPTNWAHKKMHISASMIHPDLRKAGSIYRFVLPQFTERIFHLLNFMMNVKKGRCPSRLKYAQRYILRSDGSQLRICVYSSLSPMTDVPGLLWMHGGGYATGTPEMDERFIKRFVEASGCVVVAPDYRLSVDAPYPAAREDCYAALLWLKAHGGEYGMREDQIMMGGASAGGGLTAAVSLYARDQREVAVSFQMPLYPMIDDRMNTPSATDNDAPVWNSKSNYISWKLYLGNLFDQPDVPAYAAPARAEDLKGLPPACSFVGSIEPFRDEAVAYFEKLRASGVPVHFKEFDGCFHAFDIVCSKSGVAKQAEDFLMENFCYAVQHYFAKQPSNFVSES